MASGAPAKAGCETLARRAARAVRARAGLALVHALLALAALGLAPGRAHAEEVAEYQLKAAFLYTFLGFTEWPADTDGTLNLCIYGADPFGVEIDSLAGKRVGARSLAVQRKAQLDALRSCQIVFVSSASASQLTRVVEALRGLPVLTVADVPGAAQQGAAINMKLAQGRITFEANLLAARGARLNLSSKLLRLATEVVQ